MDLDSKAAVIIGSVILLVVVTSFVIPVLDGVNYMETEENTPTGYATKTIPTGTYTVSSSAFMIDGETVVQSNTGDWILLSDSFSISIASNGNEFIVVDYDGQMAGRASSIDIDSTSGTWSGTLYSTAQSGSIGSNAMVRSATGEIALYYNTDFILDKKSDVTMFETAIDSVNISGNNAIPRAILSGTADNLTVVAAVAYAGVNVYYLDAETCTAEFVSSSIVDYDLKNYEVQANPTIKLSFEYGGQNYSVTGNQQSSIVAPLTYTKVTHGPVESMIDVVPLLMIAGLVASMIGIFIVRRD